MGGRQSCGKACSNCAAACVGPNLGPGDDFDDERPLCYPAGATFEETLEDLNTLDRQLLLFCATSNLAAVRWLLFLGAHGHACDANSTTCLHIACRAGALSIVDEMMNFKGLIKAADVAGWTPLHIAVLMGRREVVVRLLRAGAEPHVRNNKGQMAAELCADNGTYEALRSYELHAQQSPDKPWEFVQSNPCEDIIGSGMQYEPFFVPRQAVMSVPQYKKEFQQMGLAMFNQQPGYGLAFLVASGVARDYPVDMSKFLRQSNVDILQVGSFLGEAFSLSHTIRLEFINSVLLENTGVVSALVRVLRLLQLPDDLQKINRLVHGVARIWWRQHDRLLKSHGAGCGTAQDCTREEHSMDELVGLELKQYLTSSDALHQLMFSAVLLHWFLYRDGSEQLKVLDFDEWNRLNQGIEAGGIDVPEHVQRRVHAIICSGPVPELTVATEGRPHRQHVQERASEVTPRRPIIAISELLAHEGPAYIAGGGFPRPSGLAGSTQTVTYQHISNTFSESTHSSAGNRRGSGGMHDTSCASLASIPGARGGAPAPQIAPSRSVEGDSVWLGVGCSLLFFSEMPGATVPYAFVQLQKVTVTAVYGDKCTLALEGVTDQENAEVDANATRNGRHGTSEPAKVQSPTVPIIIVLLLPDGRWQELSMQRLELRFATLAEMQRWSQQLNAERMHLASERIQHGGY